MIAYNYILIIEIEMAHSDWLKHIATGLIHIPNHFKFFRA